MRIAFYAPMKPPDHPVASGDRRVARLFLAALTGAGHTPFVPTRLRTWDDGTRPGRQDRLRRLAERLADRLIRRWRGGGDSPELWFTYHSYHKSPDWIGPQVADALGIPYVIAEASHAPKRRTGPWSLGFAGAERALRRADAAITLTPEDSDGVRAVLSAGTPLIQMRPFLDHRPFAAAAAERAAWRRHWWDDDPGPWVLAVGMMRPGDKQRSYGLLAEALARLADRPWRLAIAGDGPAREAVLSRFDPDRCRPLGIVDEALMPGLYAAADMVVWPAVNEAFGMALMEAQSAGAPIVAGAERGVPEVVHDGRTGLLTPARDPEAFAAAVGALIEDPGRRVTLGAAATSVMAAEHALAPAAARLDALIASLHDHDRRTPDPICR